MKKWKKPSKVVIINFIKKWQVPEVFLDHFMDGEAILTAFGLSSGPDCLRDVLPKYGLRVKVYKSLKTSIDQELRHEVSAEYFYKTIDDDFSL